MIVFILQQYIPGAPHCGNGDLHGVYSSMELAKWQCGSQSKPWVRTNIDTQGEAESWSCDEWQLTMLEVDFNGEYLLKHKTHVIE